ncbi:DDB1- and CUL4-associated factor 13 [Trichonephila clavipes]|nr:DDB1- and CUL4-associated factor 13 [Trichonephila clavipes]
MSQRRRLPNSLRWRAVGWMEMGLSQADAARRLNVSRSVVQRLWDQYQSEDSVSRRPVPGRPRATTPAEDRFLALSARRRRTTTVPQLVADHFKASERRISATTVRNRLHNAGLYARRPVVCVTLNGRQRRNRLCWAREHVSWTQQQWASVLFTDESKFTMESDSGRLLIWREQRTRYHQSNTVERHSYRGGGILVWTGISLGGHTDLRVFHGGTVTGLRYRDEILDPYVRPYAAAIGNDFILMDDNARPHRARIVEEYLEDHAGNLKVLPFNNSAELRGIFNKILKSPLEPNSTVVGDDKVIKQWSLEEPALSEPMNAIITKTVLTGISHHRKRSIFATCGERVDIWEGTRSEPLRSLKWGVDTVKSIKFNPIEENILGSTCNNRSIVLYDIRESEPLRKIVLTLCTNAIAWNPMEAFVFVAASEDYNLYSFDMRKLNRPVKVHKDHVRAVLDVDYSPTGKEFVSGGHDATVRIFSWQSGRSSYQVIYSQFGLAIHQNDHQARRRFVKWAQNEIAVVPDFHKRILFSDEAHFWLNGYVNKQNYRIWSEANPQVYVETPLHPEKLTVWCAL